MSDASADDEGKDKAPTFTVDDALKMYEDYKSYWSDIYDEANIDLKMAAGDPATHWGEAYTTRMTAKKLTMVINELPQFIHQVTNDIRQNVPSVKVLPIADGDIETGEIFSGLFRAIEDHSHADEVVDTASEYAVKCGIGFMRIDHDYCDDESDEQEVVFKTVPDPLSVWIDPASVEYDGRDADGAICLENISKKDFERLYPKKKFSSFVDPKNTDPKDSIVIAEIFVREWSGERGKKATVSRYKFSGDDLLAVTTFPGKYIPVVPIYGEVTWIEGKRQIASLIRQARDPQLRLNHWACKEAELLSMAPIAPVMAEEGTLVNDRGQWQSPGSEMVLEYRRNSIDGEPANPPSRLQPPPIPTGIINAMEGAKQNIKESLGMYNASIGEKSNETSGVAIQRRQHEGDVATFHYPDNVRRSYGHMGEIGVEMIPVIYDTPRIIQTLNDEKDVVMVGINGAQMQEGQERKYDLTKGKYRIRITTGASYTTRRQEEAAFLSEIAQRDPNFMQIGGDILFNSMDTSGSQALAARYKKIINPALLEDKDKPQIPPQLLQELQALQQQVQQMGAELQSKQADEAIKAGELQIKQQELQLKAAETQLKMQQMQQPQESASDGDNQAFDQSIKSAELDIKEREQALKEAEFRLKAAQAVQQNPEIAESGEDFQHTSEEYAARKQQEAEMEAQELELKKIDITSRQQQAESIIAALSAIGQQVHQLNAQVSQPRNVIRDPQTGLIQGVQ
jgi:hypothetical protein